MGVLNDWQKLTRVLPGQPFGNGSDGAYSSATIPTLTKDSCSGTATSTTLTTAGSTFANGDILLIHQTRGTGVGQWEINRVSSGGGSTSLILQVALNYTYTDSGASQAQATKIPMYNSITAESGTWTLSDWAGNTDGLLVLASRSGTTVTGTITGTGKGFVRGTGVNTDNLAAVQGEGTSASGTNSTSANGNGGGGGKDNASAGGQESGGGGGGNGGAGSNGTGTGTPGTGGSTSGSADLTSITFGGAGGGGGEGGGESAGQHGGDGGGMIILFTKEITVAGGITNNGVNAVSSSERSGGGGGAGGSTLIVCQTASLGTDLVTASAGNGESGTSGSGGNGGVGRIAIHHSGTVTGTTSPTFTDVTDGSLVESTASFMFFGY